MSADSAALAKSQLQETVFSRERSTAGTLPSQEQEGSGDSPAAPVIKSASEASPSPLGAGEALSMPEQPMPIASQEGMVRTHSREPVAPGTIARGKKE